LTRPSSWLELSRANLAHNFNQIKALCPGAAPVPVIKANAYGVGAVGMAKELKELSVGALAVATVEEGVELREQGIRGGVVCLAPFAQDEAETLLEHRLTPTVFTGSAITKLLDVANNVPVGVWVKVDTGLHRFGLETTSATDFVTRLNREKRIDIEAIFSTMIEDPEKDNDQAEQLLELRNAAPELMDIPLSLASSYGILSRGGAPLLEIVRPGIMLHGFLPSAIDRLDPDRALAADLRPIATWKTHVVQTRLVPSGGRVGYGAKSLEHETSVATLMIGWSDGYTRPVSDNAAVLIKGVRCPVLSISANATMVDTGPAGDVNDGDEVVLVGRQGAEEIKATELFPGGSVYRVFAHIPPRVPRVWI
jgi:alanine racemase